MLGVAWGMTVGITWIFKASQYSEDQAYILQQVLSKQDYKTSLPLRIRFSSAGWSLIAKKQKNLTIVSDVCFFFYLYSKYKCPDTWLLYLHNRWFILHLSALELLYLFVFYCSLIKMTAHFNIKVGKFSIMMLIHCLSDSYLYLVSCWGSTLSGKNLYSSIVMCCHQPVNLEILCLW